MISITLVGQAVSYDISPVPQKVRSTKLFPMVKVSFSDGRNKYLVRVTNILRKGQIIMLEYFHDMRVLLILKL